MLLPLPQGIRTCGCIELKYAMIGQFRIGNTLAYSLFKKKEDQEAPKTRRMRNTKCEMRNGEW